MSTPLPKPNTADFQRLRYWQGQTLRSQDFSDQVAITEQFQWWHNRALHNTYGVAMGYEVTQKKNNSENDFLSVYPGVAYDCFGRQLSLPTEQKVPIPQDRQEELALVICYQGTSTSSDQDNLSRACLPSQTSHTYAGPKFFWKPSSQVSIKDGVLLGLLKQEETETIFSPFRRRSKMLARPYISHGATLPGNTAWTIWKPETDNETFSSIGFQVEIDTASAGFTDIPCYFAQLQGSFWDLLNSEAGHSLFLTTLLSDTCNVSLSNFIFAPLTHIYQATMTSFTFRLWFPGFNKLGSDGDVNQEFECNFLALAQQQKLYVSWLGIQSGSHINL